MGVFFNWPGDGSVPASRSRDAGAAIASALEALMRVLRSYERRGGDTASDIAEATNQLQRASKVFQELQSGAAHEPIAVPAHIAAAWFATDTFVHAVGRVLRGGSDIQPPPLWDRNATFTFRDLMTFAQLITQKLNTALQGFEPNLENAAQSRNVAADVAALQMFGILVAELSATNPKGQPTL